MRNNNTPNMMPLINADVLTKFFGNLDMRTFKMMHEAKTEIDNDLKAGKRLDYYAEEDPELFSYLRPNYKSKEQRTNDKAAKVLLKVEKLNALRDLMMAAAATR